MEIQLQQTRLGGFRPVYEALLRQEETLESIVPDALPDIARIASASGTVLLRQRETVEGSIRVTGTARVTVLYLPEGGGAPCCLTLNIPFLCSGDHPAIHGGCPAQATARILSADAQTLNPRKVLARVELAIDITVWGEENGQIGSGVEDQDGALQVLTGSGKDFAAVDVAEKSFSFSDVLRLPASRPPMETLLGARADLACTEARVIGKKLVIKGETALTAIYRGENGLACARFELPFSQIMEVQAGGEESFVRAEAALTGMECTQRSEDELEVSFEVLLQAAVQEEREVTLLSDLYSVTQPLETKREKVVLEPLVEQGGRRGLARQFCPCAIPVKQVVDCRLAVGEVTRAPAGESGSAITAQCYADILYLSENDSLCALSCTVPASCEIPAVPDSRGRFRCVPAGEPTATPVTGGVEVRAEMEFSWLLTRRTEDWFVSEVTPGETDPESPPRPSVVVRMAGEGERLWDIAKSCASTVADIQTANELTSANVPAGTVLLIPKCG